MRLVDVSSLAGLVPAAENHDESLTLLQVVDAVPGAVRDPQLGDSVAHGSDVTGVAGRQAVDPHLHPGTSSVPSVLVEFGSILF